MMLAAMLWRRHWRRMARARTVALSFQLLPFSWHIGRATAILPRALMARHNGATAMPPRGCDDDAQPDYCAEEMPAL